MCQSFNCHLSSTFDVCSEIEEMKELENVIDFSSKLNLTQDSLELIVEKPPMTRIQPSQSSLKKPREDAYGDMNIESSKLSLTTDSLLLVQEKLSMRKEVNSHIDNNNLAECMSKKSSKVSVLRKDSLELVRDSFRCMQKSAIKESRETSRLSLARNSLEMIKQKNKKKATKVCGRESMEFGGIGRVVKSPTTKSEEDGSKAVKVSHIEVVQFEKKEIGLVEPKGLDEFVAIDSMQKLYERKREEVTPKRKLFHLRLWCLGRMCLII